MAFMTYRRFPLLIFKRDYYLQNKAWEPLSSARKHDIEKYWGDKINPATDKTTVDPNKKCYIISMFPYPSGKLHMGHVRVYSISDALARFYKMRGLNVVHPMGWDAFGLPAENAAISQNIAPEDWTKSNIEFMKNQLLRLGYSFDWQREISTCSPEFYRWTQFIFLKLFENGFVYQKEALVNWDPVDKTVLAEEQVDANGCSWRSGAKVEKLPLKQWFVRTTKLAHSLAEGLNSMTEADWGDIIKLQRHWIGDCDGYHFELKVADMDHVLNIWTTNPELLKTARFIALSTSHILNRMENYVSSSSEFNELTYKAVNPLNGQLLPIIVSDSMDFPEGRDTLLCDPQTDPKAAEIADRLTCSRDSSECQTDLTSEKICHQALEENWGGYKTSSKLRDWLVSRQRYWGTPIPMIHCASCGTVPVPENQLPVKLPLSQPSLKGHSALTHNEDFTNVECPKCGGQAKRETDTMDTFVDSTWYYLRYLDPRNEQMPFDVKEANAAMPVDIYIGGKEHAVLHLYYARFMAHFLHHLGWIPEREPFKRLLVQGMVMGRSYRVKGSGKYLKPEEIDFSGKKPVEKETGKPLAVGWEKMSKSKFNGVEPESVWDEHGIDTTRLLILADVAPRSSRHWSKDTYPGILNWQNRMWKIITEFIKQRGLQNQTQPSNEEEKTKYENLINDNRNFYLKGVTFNIHHSQQISVGISKMQGLTNSIRKFPKHLIRDSVQFERALGVQIIMLAPLAPHFASELWAAFVDHAARRTNDFYWDKPVLEQQWPEVDMDYELEFVVKINGQESFAMKMPRHQLDQLERDDAMNLARNHETFLKYHSKKNILKTSYELYEGIQATLSLEAESKKPL